MGPYVPAYVGPYVPAYVGPYVPGYVGPYLTSLISQSQETSYYHSELVGRLFSVVEASAVGSVRLITLHMCTLLLTTLLDLSDPRLEDRCVD